MSILHKHNLTYFTDNSTKVGTNDVVGLGDNKMTVDTFRLDYGGVVAYISVTSDSCVPVLETIRGTLDNSKFIFVKVHEHYMIFAVLVLSNTKGHRTTFPAFTGGGIPRVPLHALFQVRAGI